MQNLRIWINQTILTRLIDQIDTMNDRLTKSGLGDSLIGNVGVERLRKCAALPQLKSQLTELNHLLAFLSITTQQEYLVHRLRELAKGGAISAYKWNSGGRFKGNEWSDKLPCDAEMFVTNLLSYNAQDRLQRLFVISESWGALQRISTSECLLIFEMPLHRRKIASVTSWKINRSPEYFMLCFPRRQNPKVIAKDT